MQLFIQDGFTFLEFLPKHYILFLRQNETYVWTHGNRNPK